MTYTLEKEQAITLRKKGWGVNEIAAKLGLNKSTVSFWCRDVLLSPAQISALNKKQQRASLRGLLLYSEKRKREKIIERKEIHNQGKNDIEKISQRELFLIGLSLYWAEGYKKGNNETGFTNSDPFIIKIILRWFKEIYSIPTKDLILRVSINSTHSKRVPEVLKYWSEVTKIPLTQFTTTSTIKTQSKKVYTNTDAHFGTLRVKVRRGANLRRRILGSIDGLAKALN